MEGLYGVCGDWMGSEEGCVVVVCVWDGVCVGWKWVGLGLIVFLWFWLLYFVFCVCLGWCGGGI